jgi:hypothetical protein
VGQINKIPLGYLNMLGSQTGGKNPFVANDQVSPNVEMAPFYHAHGMRAASDVLAATAVGDSVIRTVPDNEAWFLYSYGWLSTITSLADRLKLILQVSRLPQGGTAACIYTTVENQTPQSQPTSMGEAFMFPVPIPLLPGSRLTTTVTHIVNNQTMTISYLVAKFTA